MSVRLTTLGYALRRSIRTLVGMYYSPVRFSGREHLPAGPVLFVANHQDSLLDAVLVGSAARRPVRFLAKATLFEVPVLGTLLRSMGMIPAYRAVDDPGQMRKNLAILDLAAQALASGDCVGIFPEGMSHDQPRIEQIKGGTARIALKAVALGGHPLLVPVGINFERKEGFRTAVWIQIGRPLDLAAFVREHPNEKQAQRAVTAEIEAGLKRVALHLDDPALLPLLDQLEHLAPPSGLSSPGPLARLQLRKRVADAMNYFFAVDRPRAEAAAARIQAYRMALNAAGLQPVSPVMRFRRWKLGLRLLRDSLFFLAGIVPALAGLLHHAVPYLLSRKLAARCNDGRTTLALARLGFGLPLMLFMYAGAWLALRSYFLPWVAWTWVLCMPWCGFLALKKLRTLRRGGEALLAQARLYFQPGKVNSLRQQQAEIRTLVAGLADEYATIHPRGKALELPWTWQRIGRLALGWGMGLLATGLLWTGYAHHRRAQTALATGGMDLTSLPAGTLADMLDADEAVLRQWLPDIPLHLVEARQMAADFDSGKRSYYSEADNDALRVMLRRYVTLRTALVRMLWRYQKSGTVPDPQLRNRTFLCAYTAATALASAALGFVEAFDHSAEAVRKLNEAEPAWDIPPGVFDTLQRSLASSTNRRALELASEQYDHSFPEPADLRGDDAPFHRSIKESRARLAAASQRLAARHFGQPLQDARDEGKELLYGVQSLISTWMGDTKLREPGQPLISRAQVHELRARLKPGDILLQRRNWYVSNAFLPGYWPHAAIYLGTPDELRAFGLNHDPRVQAHWDQYLRHDGQGHPCVVIESISEGVVFTSLEHSIGEADSVALLRPRLLPDQIREALARAFSHTGKPYDFDFDFLTSDKLVCTELVYRAYDGALRFPLMNVLGTRTLPAIAFVRKFAAERGTASAQFDFIACLQGDRAGGCAHFVDEAGFLLTRDLPGADLLMK